MASSSSDQTASETLFEEYLTSHGYHAFQHEPDVLGSPKHPDYKITILRKDAYFEVKEFDRPKWPSPGYCGCFDPYPPIRSKIHDAQKQFRGLKGKMCSLVLANPNGAFVFLEPLFIYGAMLGNPGYTFPYKEETGSLDTSQAKRTFLSGGEMIRYSNDVPVDSWKTTFSSVCVLRCLDEGSRRQDIRIAQWKRSLDTEPTDDQVIEFVFNMESIDSLKHLRLEIYENPFAACPLDNSFGTGPFDERFGFVGDRPTRLFVGSSLRDLEAEELAAGIVRSDPGGFRQI